MARSGPVSLQAVAILDKTSAPRLSHFDPQDRGLRLVLVAAIERLKTPPLASQRVSFLRQICMVIYSTILRLPWPCAVSASSLAPARCGARPGVAGSMSRERIVEPGSACRRGDRGGKPSYISAVRLTRYQEQRTSPFRSTPYTVNRPEPKRK